ncbi:response regulator transcription factor [Serratia proteamaculans]|uniref:helix-turn-helix domain-containing protein n=1 Tax=Serratia proteamaculans TaxID=28151 RepID=UPI00107648F6|nr:LuxR C-terminal-related transcriptional regulator [Serratia proteamaculans]TFZ52678.1 response regulator transcription factor [Serratia proteamaculans]
MVMQENFLNRRTLVVHQTWPVRLAISSLLKELLYVDVFDEIKINEFKAEEEAQEYEIIIVELEDSLSIMALEIIYHYRKKSPNAIIFAFTSDRATNINPAVVEPIYSIYIGESLETIKGTFLNGLRSTHHKKGSLMKAPFLTNQEIKVLCYLLSGIQVDNLAKKLCLSKKTISVHKTNALRKLDVKHLIELHPIRNCLSSYMKQTHFHLQTSIFTHIHEH